MVNECKFYLNHHPAQGLSGNKMHTLKVQRDKSNNLFFLHKEGFEIGVVTLWSKLTLSNKGREGCMLFANSGQA